MNNTSQTNQSMILVIIYGLILVSAFFVTKSYGMDLKDFKAKKGEFKDEYIDDIANSAGEMGDWCGIDMRTEFALKNKVGFKYDDLDYQDITEKEYQKDFGVKIYKIYDDSPADEAGLRIGDIIMIFGLDTIWNEDELDRLLEDKDAKDDVSVIYFRDGKEESTTIYLKKEYEYNSSYSTGDFKRRKKYRVGILGFYWSPSFVFNEYNAANDLLSDLGFPDNQIEQLWFNEFGFKFYVGKNTFLGMVFAGADAEGVTKLSLAESGDNITRKMKFEQGMWGFTLDKRYRPFKRTMFETGFFIGRGKSILTLQQQNGEVVWDELWTAENKYSNNNNLKIKKRELVFEPRVSAMHRLIGPVWLKVEAGYMLGYSNKHWRDITDKDDEYTISGAPKSSLFDGFTFTISPWIGF